MNSLQVSHRLSRRYDNGLQHRADSGIAQQLSIPVKSEVSEHPSFRSVTASRPRYLPADSQRQTSVALRSGAPICASPWRNGQKWADRWEMPRMGRFSVAARCPNVVPFGDGLFPALISSNVHVGGGRISSHPVEVRYRVRFCGRESISMVRVKPGANGAMPGAGRVIRWCPSDRGGCGRFGLTVWTRSGPG